MKLRLTAELEGVLDLHTASSSIVADRPPFTLVLTSDERKRVTSVSVSIAIDHDAAQKCRSMSEGGRLDVEFPPDVYEQAVQQLQLLESNLSFAFPTAAAVKRIGWDEPTIDLIPENPSEEALINTWGIHIESRYPEPPGILAAREFQELVVNAPKYDSLAIVKAFLREGKK
jgi:hypothetical protein